MKSAQTIENAVLKLPQYIPANANVASHAHGVILSGHLLAHIFSAWTAKEMINSETGKMFAQPLERAAGALRCLVAELAQETDEKLLFAINEVAEKQIRAKFSTDEKALNQALSSTRWTYDQSGIAQIRTALGAWSQVAGNDVLRLFGGSLEQSDRLMAVLGQCPSPHFVWRLIAPGIFQWPLLPASFEQQVDTIKLFFIHDCINDLGRPMPIAEIGELVYNHGADQGQFDELIRKVLSPAEFAYAVAMGVLVLDLNPENLPLGHTPAPVLKLNPLYARKC